MRTISRQDFLKLVGQHFGADFAANYEGRPAADKARSGLCDTANQETVQTPSAPRTPIRFNSKVPKGRLRKDLIEFKEGTC